VARTVTRRSATPRWARSQTLTDAPTVPEAFDRVAAARPRDLALVSEGARLRYGELRSQVNGLTAALRRLGLQPGDRVVLLLATGPDFVRMFLAVSAGGAACVPLSPEIGEAELTSILTTTQPAFAVTAAGSSTSSLESALHRIVVKAQNPPVVLFVGGSAPSWGLALHELPDQSSSDPPTLEPGSVAAIFCTSGTSGRPKAVVHTHRSLMAATLQLDRVRREYFRRLDLEHVRRLAGLAVRFRLRLLRGLGNQVWTTPMPAYTIGGFQVVMQALLSGNTLVVRDRFEPEDLLQTISREGVTILAVSPTMIDAILRWSGGKRRPNLRSLTVVGVGSAPTSPDLVRRARRFFGCPVVIGYGSTETGGGVLATKLSDDDRHALETVGRALPGVEVRVVDDAHRPAPPGTLGVLACKVDSLMTGYLASPPRSGEAAIDADGGTAIDAEGWYYTGDLAIMDRSGYVRIIGRQSDVINRGGFKVHPVEVESVLESHPMVLRAAVVGVPAPFAGEITWAFVILEDGHSIRGGELRQYCAKRVPLRKVPDHISFVDTLPSTESGEIQRHLLRALAAGSMESRRKIHD
jgi:fatty-acyl-CoA synthase